MQQRATTADLLVGAHSALDRLISLMDSSRGWSFDTYDARVGRAYVWLAQRRKQFIPRTLLYCLYALEFLAPLTYRRIRGIPKSWDPMGNSYRAGVELTLLELEPSETRRDRARSILDEISAKAVGTIGRRGFALGFPCVTGSNRLWVTSTPVAHYTLRVARKLLRWEQVTGDLRYRPVLTEAINFLLDELPWIEREGTVGVGYTPDDPLQVVNIWADVASILAAHDRQCGTSRSGGRARALLGSVLDHQDADGGWPYFAKWEAMAGARDNTHSAMVLGALADLALSYPDAAAAIRPALERGIDWWIRAFFDERTGKHWNLIGASNDSYTVCVGDTLYAINRLVRPGVGLHAETVERLELLEESVVQWSLLNLRRRDGHFCERRLRNVRYTLESIRSFDGLVADAFALFLARKKLGNSRQLWTQ